MRGWEVKTDGLTDCREAWRPGSYEANQLHIQKAKSDLSLTFKPSSFQPLHPTYSI